MLLLAIYPLLLLFLCGLSLFSQRKGDDRNTLGLAHAGLFLSFLMPWVLILTTIIKGHYPDWTIGVSHLTQNADLWLLACQAMFALMLLLIRKHVESQEAWFKSTISLLFGVLFLQLALHPAMGLGFPISTDVAQIISAVSFIVGVYLLFGLPPLQLGTIDLGSEKSASLHIYINLISRFCLGFIVLFTMSFANWMGDLAYLEGFIAAAILAGVASTRLVLRLQSNIFRTLAYLASGFALSIVAKILFADLADLFFFIQILFIIPLLMLLMSEPSENSNALAHQNWVSFRAFHRHAAARFHGALKAFLFMECAATLAMAIALAMRGQWIVALVSLGTSFSALVVTQDKQAFAPHAAA